MQSFYKSIGESSCDFVPELFDLTLRYDSIGEELPDKSALIEFQRFFNNVMKSSIFDKIEEQSTDTGVLNRYELHKVHSENGTDVVSKPPSRNELAEKKRMIAIIQSCYFEAGIWSEADDYFEALGQRSGSIEVPLKILSDIVNHNMSNDHILEGALHILSNYSYEEIDPYGISVALVCVVNHSPVIQDLLISCFEKWGSTESIDILESLNLDEPWLAEYRDEVVAQLKSKEMSA